MQGLFTPPPVTGYRALSAQEVAAMNALKAAATAAEAAITELRATGLDLDERWIAIGTTDLQTGFMALTRAVARPTNF